MRILLTTVLLSAGCYAVHEPGSDPGAERPTCGEGQVCDSDPGEGERVCFYPAGAPPGTRHVAEAVYRFETTSLGEAVRVSLILGESFVDNTYGERSSPGYRDGRRPHTFLDLVRSDHAQFALLDANGRRSVEVAVDLLSEADDAPSGYRSLGVWGGDGEVVYGAERTILFATSSLDDNFNLRGCPFTESSPSPGECPDWEPRVIYTVWVSHEPFGEVGFGSPALDHVHASPSRMRDTLEVEPGPCP